MGKKSKGEKVYDEQISPLMKQIIDICKENEMPLFATVQYNKCSFATTAIPQTKGHMLVDVLNIMRQCIEGNGINMDKFLISIMKQYPNKSSIMMQQLGYKISNS